MDDARYKKVVAVNSSRKKGNTYTILKALGERLSAAGVDFEMLHLRDYNINHCTGCERCITIGRCTQKDDFGRVQASLTGADGIVLSSPVYMGSVTGRLKVLFDRTCSWYHRPVLVGKPALIVTTTAGSYATYTARYMKRTVIGWGMHPSGTILRKARTLNIRLSENEYDAFIHRLFSPLSQYRPTLAQLIHFGVQKVLALKILEIDTEFWKDRGWDESPFYYRCRIGPLKRIFSWVFYKLLFYRVKKTDRS
ncbi:MAG: flavodoxin family protein [Spirochaetes bacterium]|nr:flavodoxin family protein [Spirochaetota bacterium]